MLFVLNKIYLFPGPKFLALLLDRVSQHQLLPDPEQGASLARHISEVTEGIGKTRKTEKQTYG